MFRMIRAIVPTWGATLLVAAVMFRLDARQTVLFVVEGLVFALVASALHLWLVGRRQLATVAAWVDSGVGDPDSVMDATREFAVRVLRPQALLQAFAMAAIINAWMVHQFLNDSLLAFAGFMIGMLGVVGGCFFVVVLAWEGSVRPVIAAAAPIATAPATAERIGISHRLISTVAFTCWAGGFIVSAVVVRTDSPPVQFATAAAGSFVVSALLTSMYARRNVAAVLRPVRQLTDATKRVAVGDFTQPVPVWSHDEFADLSDSFNLMQRGQRDREALHKAFASYVDPTLARQLLEQGDASFEGEDVQATVVFVDVRDFTAYADHVTGKEAVYRLNLLFGVVVPILQERGGHANKFLGDGLLAAFGAPEPLTSHADAAVQAAIEIQRAVHDAFGDVLAIGIGINTGRVIAGTVGAAGKSEYTLIGDPVNVAARVEQLTKETGDQILITESTRSALSRDDFVIPRGSFPLKGKRLETAVFAVAT